MDSDRASSQEKRDSLDAKTRDASGDDVHHLHLTGPQSALQSAKPIDEANEKRLRRKIDLHVIPTVAIIYMFCFIDRANIGNARLAGMEKDLGMNPLGFDYNVLLSAFYVAYIVFELPSNLLCKIVGPGRWLPLLTVAFGILSLCTAFVETFGSAIAVRFLLGVAEAGQLPGIAYYLSRWYRRDELACELAPRFPRSCSAVLTRYLRRQSACPCTLSAL